MSKDAERKRLDPAKTRETILIAAFDVFAQKGYDGASVADIAAAAGVPKSLLQYHYGSKEELWKACLERKAGPVISALDRFLEAGDVAEFVAVRFQLLQENPQVARIMAWLSLGSAPLPTFMEERRARLFERGRGSPSGAEFPRLLLALAAMDGWFLYRDLYSRVLGAAVFEEAFVSRLRQLLTGVVQADPKGAEETTP